MNPAEVRAKASKPGLERDRRRFLAKKAKGQKGWCWVTLEQMDARCMRHKRMVFRRVFFGRRATIITDPWCRMRCVTKRSRRLAAENLTELPGLEPEPKKRRKGKR